MKVNGLSESILDVSGLSVWAVIKTTCHPLKSAFTRRVSNPLWCSLSGGSCLEIWGFMGIKESDVAADGQQFNILRKLLLLLLLDILFLYNFEMISFASLQSWNVPDLSF